MGGATVIRKSRRDAAPARTAPATPHGPRESRRRDARQRLEILYVELLFTNMGMPARLDQLR